MYLMTCTRPDLAYPLSILARYVAPGRHRPEHMAAAKRVLRYLCSTPGLGLVLGGRRPVVLTGHADASWADDQATQRSSQGYTFSLGSGSVSWRSTRSSSVLGSSCEAEIYAGAMAAQELRWLTYLLTDLEEPPRSPPVLYVDNKAMLALCREHRLEHRTKHIALRYFLARELQQRGQMRLAYVASEANTADIFTKALSPGDHQRFCTMLGLLALLCLTGQIGVGQIRVGQIGVGKICVGQNGVGQNGVGQIRVGQNGIGQNSIGQNGVGQNGVGIILVGQKDVGQNDVGQNGVGQNDVEQNGIVQIGVGQIGVGQIGVGQIDVGQIRVGPICVEPIRVGQNDVGQNGVDKTALDKTAFDKLALDKSALDKSALDKSALDKSASDKSAWDKLALDKRALDKLALDKTALDKSSLDKTALYKMGLDKTALDKTALDKSALDKWLLDKTVALDKTALEKTALDKSALDNSALDKTAAALGASESVLPSTTPTEALHTFTLDSGASRCFFRDSTTLTPLPAPVPVRLADPSKGPIGARSSTVLPCPAVPSGSLSGLHLPSFCTNLVSTTALQDAMVTTTTPGDSSVAPPPGSPLPATPSWHALPSLVSGLPRSLQTFPPSPAPPCLPCVEGQQRATPHSSFPPTTAPLQTLHMDVWGPARVSGQGRERYFLLVVDDYTRYTTVFPLCSKGQDFLIPWIRVVRLQLRERFSTDLPLLRLHSHRGGEFSSDLLRDFCRGEGILQSFTLLASPQQNGIAERRIGLVMEVARTSMIHAAAPHFLWPFAVWYAAHQLNLWPRVSLPETSPTLRWTGQVWGSRAIVRDTDSGGTVWLRPYFVLLLQQVLGGPSSPGLTPPLLCPPPDPSQPLLQPASALPTPSPYTEQAGGLTERREPTSRPASLVRTGHHVPRPCPPPVPGTHAMVPRPSSDPLHVRLPPPLESSLLAVPDPESDRARAATPTFSLLLAAVVIYPSFESAAASPLIAELVDFAVTCRLDYATALVVESESASPPSVGGECALGTDVLEDWQEDFECLEAAVPRFASMLLAPEGDPDAPDILTPRSYAKAITSPYSSQWQAAMDPEMASWKSTGTYVDAVPPSWANIVDGMWIFRVKRPLGSPPAFKARYVATGFTPRQGVNYFQTFSPTLKMTTLRVLLHVAAQRDYELHSLEFTSGGQSSVSARLCEWHDTLRTTLAASGFTPSTADPSLFLHTDTSVPLFYILVYVDDLVFATTEMEALNLVKSELQKRHTCTDLGELRSYVLQRFSFQFSLQQPTPLSTSHSLSAPPSDMSVEPSGPYPKLVGCLITSGMGLVLGGRGPVVLTGHADASWVVDSATQRPSQGYTFSLGSGSVSWRSTRSSLVLSSSCEAEIYTGPMAAQELCWLTYLLSDLGEQPCSPPRGQLRLVYVATRANTADIFTKALPPGDHQRFSTVLACFAFLDWSSSPAADKSYLQQQHQQQQQYQQQPMYGMPLSSQPVHTTAAAASSAAAAATAASAATTGAAAVTGSSSQLGQQSSFVPTGPYQYQGAYQPTNLQQRVNAAVLSLN
ncbi:unnamed protein product [Closterium sp. NIES-53]